MTEHMIVRLCPEDRPVHASFIARIQDEIRHGRDTTLEVIEDAPPGVITIKYEWSEGRSLEFRYDD